MRSVVVAYAAGLLLSVAATGPALASVWWMGPANPAGVSLFDLSKTSIDGQNRRTVTQVTLMPKDTMINGQQTPVIMSHVRFDCAAGSSQLIDGAAMSESARPVVNVPPERAPSRLAPTTAGWSVLKLVCADADDDRRRFGRFIGEADLGGLIERLRPPARAR